MSYFEHLGFAMTTHKPSKREEYMQAAERCLEVARTLASRERRMQKRIQAAEWLKRAEAAKPAPRQNKA